MVTIGDVGVLLQAYREHPEHKGVTYPLAYNGERVWSHVLSAFVLRWLRGRLAPDAGADGKVYYAQGHKSLFQLITGRPWEDAK